MLRKSKGWSMMETKTLPPRDKGTKGASLMWEPLNVWHRGLRSPQLLPGSPEAQRRAGVFHMEEMDKSRMCKITSERALLGWSLGGKEIPALVQMDAACPLLWWRLVGELRRHTANSDEAPDPRGREQVPAYQSLAVKATGSLEVLFIRVHSKMLKLLPVRLSCSCVDKGGCSWVFTKVAHEILESSLFWFGFVFLYSSRYG